MNRKQKKGALGLSVNFIVMFILAITVFALGMTIVYKIFGQADEIKKDMDESTRKQVEGALMKSGSKVVIPISKKVVKQGDKDYFALGIKNEEAVATTFDIIVTCDNAFNVKTKERICATGVGNDPNCEVCNYWTFDPDPVTIPSNDRYIESINFIVPKKARDDNYPILPGRYTFDVEVEIQGQRYGTLKKFYIELN